MKSLKSKKWWGSTLVRAIKAFAQTFVATISTTAILEQVKWQLVISASFLSAILSVMTSLGSLPELSEEDKNEIS